MEIGRMKMIKIAYGNVGENNPNYGKGVWWQRQGKSHPRLGQKNSEHTNEQIRIANTGRRAWNKELYGEANPQYQYGSRSFYRAEAQRVWENYWNEQAPKGYDIHHVDKNPKNNNISNLVLMTRSGHKKRHNKDRRNNNYKDSQGL